MGRVVWTHEAADWLAEIHDFIARDHPEAAVRTVRAIYDRALSLQQFPHRGRPVTILGGKRVRVLLHGHYRIAYTVSGEDVTILGILHGALDLERHL